MVIVDDAGLIQIVNRQTEGLFGYPRAELLGQPVEVLVPARRYRGQLDADADKFIGFAVDGARRMQELINDLLTYSRVGTQPLQAEAVDTNQLADRVVSDLATTIAETGASVARDNLPTVRGDATQLRQVFQNLIANGIKFHRPDESPRVHMSATQAPGAWTFSVSDNGIGIEPQYLERIFTLFQRLHTRAGYPGIPVVVLTTSRAEQDGYGVTSSRRTAALPSRWTWSSSSPS